MKYVLAVSGGVDSCVLLDLVAQSLSFRAQPRDPELDLLQREFLENNAKVFQNAKFPDDFIVAHFEHGIRGQESQEDAEFVRNLAGKYGVKIIIGEGNLPPDCNEETAREKRYEFLNEVANCHSGLDPESSDKEVVKDDANNNWILDRTQNNKNAIVTAHHQDDLLETVVINLIRGTNWRGLAPMTGDVARPLLNLNKAEIIAYAIDHKLDWVEEEANYGPRYFRNRVRDFLARTNHGDRQKLLALCEKQKTIRVEIEKEIMNVCHSGLDPESSEMHQHERFIRNKCENSNNKIVLSRYFLTMIDEKSALEILRAATKGQLTYPRLNKVLLFAKTALPHKKISFKGVEICVSLREIFIKMS